MSSTRPVLVTVSLIVHAPKDFSALEDTLDRVSNQLGQAIRNVVASDASMEALDCFPYHYLGEEGENAYRCSECGKWATDRTLPHVIDGLPNGSTVGGIFLCDECWFWRKQGEESRDLV